MVGFKAAQCEGRVTDAHGDGLAAWKSKCNDAKGFAYHESEFEQAQADVAALEFGYTGAHLADSDDLPHANAAQRNALVRDRGGSRECI